MREWPRGIATALALAASWLALAGCGGSEFSSSGSGGATASGGSGGTGTGATGTGGGGATCNGGRCVQKPPNEWSGPVVISESASDPAVCEGDYAQLEFTRHAGLNAAPSDCECGCDPTNVTCGPIGVSVYAAANCGEPPCSTVGELPAHVCWAGGNVLSTCTTATSYKLVASANGTCIPKTNKSIPLGTWTKTFGACGPSSTPPTCGDGESNCYPTPPPGGQICIYRSEPQTCPAGWVPLAAGATLYSDFDDTRSCVGTCKCGVSFCGGVAMFSDATCTQKLGSAVAPSQCEPLPTKPATVKAVPQPGCPVIDDFNPTGSAIPTGPVTVCCLAG